MAQASALTENVQLDLAVGGEPDSLAGPTSLYAAAVEELHGN